MAKKEKHCDRDDPADDLCGDCWDYVALDPEHRLVVSALVGRHAAGHELHCHHPGDHEDGQGGDQR